MYAASRATIVRRLTEAREALVDAVKGELRATAGIEAQDFESILRLVKSQLDLRLSVILKDPDTIS